MKVNVIKDCKVLLRNKKHKNFTETDIEIKKGTVLNGKPIEVNGLRRGEPFKYRLFLTNNKEFIYLNCIENMKATEIKLGADDSQTPTFVNLKGNEMFSKNKTMGLAIGGLAGFMYSRYKKHDWKKTTMTVLGSALIGYTASYVLTKDKSINFIPSK